ncbi:hypothetical protein KFE25_013249 [Diacronema lutheri]|uniref:Uncharacterized protein n=1 Tax=Diacronema lutheri TaxID=2081491 RepID=A0A8J5XSI9_DIALT|nr:hypothetical protein KFE25_004296 [Diacronema lutheri]KAG8468166.1 hypothetical protein KFE25_013249 [Diacronema lutheri]
MGSSSPAPPVARSRAAACVVRTLMAQHVAACLEGMHQVRGDAGILGSRVQIDAHHDIVLGLATCYPRLSVHLTSADPLSPRTAGRVRIYDGQEPRRPLGDVLLEAVQVIVAVAYPSVKRASAIDATSSAEPARAEVGGRLCAISGATDAHATSSTTCGATRYGGQSSGQSSDAYEPAISPSLNARKAPHRLLLFLVGEDGAAGPRYPAEAVRRALFAALCAKRSRVVVDEESVDWMIGVLSGPEFRAPRALVAEWGKGPPRPRRGRGAAADAPGAGAAGCTGAGARASAPPVPVPPPAALAPSAAPPSGAGVDAARASGAQAVAGSGAAGGETTDAARPVPRSPPPPAPSPPPPSPAPRPSPAMSEPLRPPPGDVWLASAGGSAKGAELGRAKSRCPLLARAAARAPAARAAQAEQLPRLNSPAAVLRRVDEIRDATPALGGAARDRAGGRRGRRAWPTASCRRACSQPRRCATSASG